MTRLPRWAERGRRRWRYTGRLRPPFAAEPGPGRESVWDYPRPPRVVADSRHVVVRLEGAVIAETSASLRVLETASPPVFYLPPDATRTEVLATTSGSSRCEWKGVASYWDVVARGTRIRRAAWSYPAPFPGFEPIRGYFSFYPARVECSVAGERVTGQPGGFYGGWVTRELTGPFKGEPGSEWW